MNMLTAAILAALGHDCHCADAESLKPGYVCPMGHTY